MLMMVLAGQSVWAQKIEPKLEITDAANNYVLADGATLSTTYYPNWVGFNRPSTSLYIVEGGLNKSVADKYQITYYIDGHEDDTSFSSDANGNQITTDATTGTTITRFYGDAVIGSSAGTVTVRVVAKVKEAFKDEYKEKVEQTYIINIQKVTPTVAATPSPLSLRVQQVWKNQDGSNLTWSYRNEASKVALPTPSVTITENGRTQDLSEYFDITYAPKTAADAEKIYICTDNSRVNKNGYATYLSAKLNGTDSIGSNVANEEDIVKPYSTTPGAATLLITFTPKSEYANAYNATTLDVNVNINFMESSAPKMTATLSMINPLTNQPMAEGETLHFVKYGHKYYDEQYLHPYPIPVVTGSDGTDLSKHSQLAVKFFAVEDNSYEDRCEAPETDVNWKLKIDHAGQPTGTVSVMGHIEGYNLSGAAAKFQTGKPGLIKVGMVIVANHYEGEGNGIESLYQFTERTPYAGSVNAYGSTRETVERCLTDTTYFYIDVMKRSPRLVFDPDPSTVQLTKGNEITFNNRFEVSGVIDDANDGEAGTLVYGAQWGSGSSTFQYSFEFPADAGIVVENWPHYDRMVALDVNGDRVEPAGYDWNNNGAPYWTPADSTRIATWKFWSVKGWGTDKLWTMKFTKDSEEYKAAHNGEDIKIKYTIWPWNHVMWDIGEEQIVTYHVTESKVPQLHIDPAELMATVSQQGFAEPDVWVTDNLGGEVSDDFEFRYTIDSDKSDPTGTTVANSADLSFLHEVTIGNTAGDVTVHVVATNKTDPSTGDYIGGYTEHVLKGDYVIHILAGDPLYEIISSKTPGAVRNTGNTGTTDFDYAQDKVMGKMHFIGTGKIYAGYTISGVPGLNIRFGKFDGSVWTVKADDTEEIGSHDNANDIRNGVVGDEGKGNRFITDDTPVALDKYGIAQGGAFYEFYALTNGFLTVDARWVAGQSYVLIDYDDPDVKEVFSPAALVKGDHTFTMPLLEDHSYHLYCSTGGSINMHGLRFEPAFLKNGARSTSGSAFMNGFSDIPTLAEATLPEVTYASANTTIAEVNASTGAITPKTLSFNPVRITGTVASQTDATNIFKMPYYDLVVADIPTYRLGDGLDTSGSDLDDAEYGGAPGTKVTTYNIATPIRMTYGGWNNPYTQTLPTGVTKNISKDTYKNKGEWGVGGFTEDDHQFNKLIDNFQWSNVCDVNPSDERGYTNYKSYVVGAANMNDTYYRNTFSVPAHGAYWRFEPRTSGYLFVYLVQNGICSYTGDAHSLKNTTKYYYGLDWKPLYIVDETGAPVSSATDVNEIGNAAVRNFLGNQGTYTEGLIRCNKNDAEVKSAAESAGELPTSDFSFLWTFTKSGASAGFENDYVGDASTFKSNIISAWSNAGETQTVFQDPNSTGFSMISKAYVRYAIRVKAGKSYWVFQNASKPQFCGFGFVPDGFDGAPANNDGPAPVAVTISDDDDVAVDQYLGGSFSSYNVPLNVTYAGRTFKNQTWTSLCLPFAVSEYNFKKVFGEKAKIVTYEKLTKDNTNIHFIQHNYRMMEAGRPYFICPDYDKVEGTAPASKTNIVFEGVTIEKINDEVIPAASDITEDSHKEKIFASNGFEFVGTKDYKSDMMPVFSYFMSDAGKLKRVGAKDPSTGDLRDPEKGLSIGRYRAYLKNPTHNENFAKIGMSNFEEPYEDVPEDQQNVVTRIAGVTDGSVFDSMGSILMNGVFTIDGRKVGNSTTDAEKLPAGVYIVNGKKQVIK